MQWALNDSPELRGLLALLLEQPLDDWLGEPGRNVLSLPGLGPLRLRGPDPSRLGR